MLRNLFLIALLVLFVCSAALADPILLAPRGTTLSTAQIRAEAALSPGNDEGSWYWLGTGFAQFEANIIRFKPRTGKSEDMINVQWNFLPETLLTPALTFGVVDAADESDEGTGIFVAATRHFPIGKVSRIIKDVSLTAGVGTSGIDGVFGGLEVKLPYGISLQGEFDSHDYNAAVGWQPISLLRLKAYWIRDEVYYGAELTPIKF